MDDQRFGSVIRSVRIRRRWRQLDLAKRTCLSTSTISRLERGHFDGLSIRSVRHVAAALDVRVELLGRWRAGDLDRLLNARHSALHEEVARWFGNQMKEWVFEPEVSYSVYGERGVIDIVGWHEGATALLVIELKTDIVDVNDLVGRVSQKRRLAATVALERGWKPSSTSAWVIVAASRTNRARVAAHGAMLRAAFPTDGRGVETWLHRPTGKVSALSMWKAQGTAAKTNLTSNRRVRPERRAAA